MNLNLNTIDAKQILELHNSLMPKLSESTKLLKVLTEIEIPLAIVLKNMERTGVLIDNVKLSKQAKNKFLVKKFMT